MIRRRLNRQFESVETKVFLYIYRPPKDSWKIEDRDNINGGKRPDFNKIRSDIQLRNRNLSALVNAKERLSQALKKNNEEEINTEVSNIAKDIVLETFKRKLEIIYREKFGGKKSSELKEGFIKNAKEIFDSLNVIDKRISEISTSTVVIFIGGIKDKKVAEIINKYTEEIDIISEIKVVKPSLPKELFFKDLTIKELREESDLYKSLIADVSKRDIKGIESKIDKLKQSLDKQKKELKIEEKRFSTKLGRNTKVSYEISERNYFVLDISDLFMGFRFSNEDKFEHIGYSGYVDLENAALTINSIQRRLRNNSMINSIDDLISRCAAYGTLLPEVTSDSFTKSINVSKEAMKNRAKRHSDRESILLEDLIQLNDYIVVLTRVSERGPIESAGQQTKIGREIEEISIREKSKEKNKNLNFNISLDLKKTNSELYLINVLGYTVAMQGLVHEKFSQFGEEPKITISFGSWTSLMDSTRVVFRSGLLTKTIFEIGQLEGFDMSSDNPDLTLLGNNFQNKTFDEIIAELLEFTYGFSFPSNEEGKPILGKGFIDITRIIILGNLHRIPLFIPTFVFGLTMERLGFRVRRPRKEIDKETLNRTINEIKSILKNIAESEKDFTRLSNLSERKKQVESQFIEAAKKNVLAMKEVNKNKEQIEKKSSLGALKEISLTGVFFEQQKFGELKETERKKITASMLKESTDELFKAREELNEINSEIPDKGFIQSRITKSKKNLEEALNKISEIDNDRPSIIDYKFEFNFRPMLTTMSNGILYQPHLMSPLGILTDIKKKVLFEIFERPSGFLTIGPHNLNSNIVIPLNHHRTIDIVDIDNLDIRKDDWRQALTNIISTSKVSFVVDLFGEILGELGVFYFHNGKVMATHGFRVSDSFENPIIPQLSQIKNTGLEAAVTYAMIVLALNNSAIPTATISATYDPFVTAGKILIDKIHGKIGFIHSVYYDVDIRSSTAYMVIYLNYVRDLDPESKSFDIIPTIRSLLEFIPEAKNRIISENTDPRIDPTYPEGNHYSNKFFNRKLQNVKNTIKVGKKGFVTV